MEQAAKWPGRLRELAAAWSGRDVRSAGTEDTIEGEIWLLLHTALAAYLLRGIRSAELRREELTGLAAEKTAELVRQIAGGRWRPEGEDDLRIQAYVRETARHAAGGFWKKWYREREEPLADLDAAPGLSPASPEECAAGGELAQQIHRWLGRFRPLHAEIFVMKAFYQLPSRDVAEHPRVRTSPTNVDTVWDRMRKELRSLIEESGRPPDRLPAGTFSSFLLLWESAAVRPAAEGPAEGGR